MARLGRWAVWGKSGDGARLETWTVWGKGATGLDQRGEQYGERGGDRTRLERWPVV